VNKDSPRSGPPSNPASDPQFARWEYPVQLWAHNNPQSLTAMQALAASPSAQTQAAFSILSPRGGTTVSAFVPLYVSASYSRPESVSRVAYYLNGQFVGSSAVPPYGVSFMPATHGPSVLRAVAESALGNQEQTVSFIIR